MRFFNTAGPVNCQDHYCVPPLQRFELDKILGLINQKKYFVLHAPRQVGKTTYLLALMDHLNQTGLYRSLYINVELAQSAREDVTTAMRAILSELGSQARTSLGDSFVDAIWPDVLAQSGGHGALIEVLSRWAESNPKPLVLLIDEIDALIGDTLIAVLRQLRVGYAKRPDFFPQSVVLCGVRDVRDYRIHSSRDKEIITGGSAFNIRAESLRMGDFTRPQLLMQAFLQRIVKGGGRVEREYGLGRRSTDLLVIWPTPDGVQRAVIELKVLGRSLEQTVADGLAQTWRYMDASGAEAGHLVIFDRAPDRSWQEKIFQRAMSFQDRPITVWGM